MEEVRTYLSNLCPPKGMEGAAGVVSKVNLGGFYWINACLNK